MVFHHLRLTKIATFEWKPDYWEERNAMIFQTGIRSFWITLKPFIAKYCLYFLTSTHFNHCVRWAWMSDCHGDAQIVGRIPPDVSRKGFWDTDWPSDTLPLKDTDTFRMDCNQVLSLGVGGITVCHHHRCHALPQHGFCNTIITMMKVSAY